MDGFDGGDGFGGEQGDRWEPFRPEPDADDSLRHELDSATAEPGLGFANRFISAIEPDLLDPTAELAGFDPTFDAFHASLTEVGLGYGHFDPSSFEGAVIGDPVAEMAHWHRQDYPDTCAVVCQEYVLEGLTGLDLDEDLLRQQAYAYGLYTPNGGGTPLGHIGDLLEVNGVDVQQRFDASLNDLASELNARHDVIVAVDSRVIWEATHDPASTSLEDYPGIPGQRPDHAVQVVAITGADTGHPMVVLNDPGIPDGRGVQVPLAQFHAAWSASDCFMVNTTGSPLVDATNNLAELGAANVGYAGRFDVPGATSAAGNPVVSDASGNLYDRQTGDPLSRY